MWHNEADSLLCIPLVRTQCGVDGVDRVVSFSCCDSSSSVMLLSFVLLFWFCWLSFSDLAILLFGLAIFFLLFILVKASLSLSSSLCVTPISALPRESRRRAHRVPQRRGMTTTLQHFLLFRMEHIKRRSVGHHQILIE